MLQSDILLKSSLHRMVILRSVRPEEDLYQNPGERGLAIYGSDIPLHCAHCYIRIFKCIFNSIPRFIKSISRLEC